MHKARHRKKMGLEVLPLQKHVGCHLVCVPWLKEARENTTSLGSHYLWFKVCFFRLFVSPLGQKPFWVLCKGSLFKKPWKRAFVSCERAQRYEQHKCHFQPKQPEKPLKEKAKDEPMDEEKEEDEWWHRDWKSSHKSWDEWWKESQSWQQVYQQAYQQNWHQQAYRPTSRTGSSNRPTSKTGSSGGLKDCFGIFFDGMFVS